jgi:RNA polymerase I-specific transcription initiation factor RRN5
MSSESDVHAPRRQSSTPDTPRKRRRLASDASSRRSRRHKELRRSDVEDRYNDDYRLLFNEHVARAASRFDVNESARRSSIQIGSSVWSTKEQDVFFAALERLGRDDTPGIAGAIGTKSEAETRDFLLTLQDAAVERGDTRLTLRDIPAAIQLGSECDRQLEHAADALAWYQERLEASLEQERYGDYWLITPPIADELDDAINGVVPPRSVSTPHISQPNEVGSGVVQSCIACRKRKSRCDQQTPCGKCITKGTSCEYVNKDLNGEDTSRTSHDLARPRSASRADASDPDQISGGYMGYGYSFPSLVPL